MRILLLISFLSFLMVAKSQDTIPVFSLEQYQNRVLQKNDTLFVVNFWATWCLPCVLELPYFEAERQAWKGKPVQFILVSNDTKNSAPHVKQFLSKNHYRAEVFILSAGNPNIWINQVEPNWSGTIPMTLLYRNAEKLSFHEGEFANQIELQTFIQSKL